MVRLKSVKIFLMQIVSDGKKNELTGGGLIRSLGGWVEAKEKLRSGVHIISDERILGDSDFVDSIITQSEEKYERRHRLKRKGYDLDRIAERVSEELDIESDEVYSKGKQYGKVRARSLLCYWAQRELGISHTELAKRFELSLAAIGFSVERGGLIAKEGKYVPENVQR